MRNNFIDDNVKHFAFGADYWEMRLNDVIKFIDDKNKTPVQCSKDLREKKLGKWLSTQRQNSKTKKFIFKLNEVTEKWNEFVEKYS